MSNELAIAGIQAVLRLGQAGSKLYMERANDKSVFLPDIKVPNVSIEGQLGYFLKKLSKQELASYVEFQEIWHEQRQYVDISNMTAVNEAFTKMMLIEAEKYVSKNAHGELSELEKQDKGKLLAGGRLIEQWRADKELPSAFARLALTIADIGLEFVTTQPQLFGIDGKGEKFVVSFAQKLADCIPDDVMTFGNGINFNNRIVAILLKAGLGTIIDKTDVIFDEAKIEKLVTGILVPVVESLPTDVSKQYTYRQSVDALLGPSAAAALSILAEDTETYFGDDFTSSAALGAVTTAMLESASQTITHETILSVLSKEGMIEIYTSILKVAMQHPKLFMNADEPPTANQDYALSLITNIADILSADPYLKGAFGTHLAASIINITGEHAGVLLALDIDKSWDLVATNTIQNITTVISNNLKLGNNRIALFGKQHCLQLSHIIVSEIAKNPAMLGFTDELSQKISRAVASAMKEDTNLLLNNKEWLKITAIVATFAVADKDLLLAVIDENEQTILSVTLTGVLAATNKDWTLGNKPKISFGNTLLKVIELVVVNVTDNVNKVAENPKLIEQYFVRVLGFVNTQKQVSSGALTRLVTKTIALTLASGELPMNEQLKEMLS